MADVTIRPAQPTEAEAIQDLGRAAWHAAYDEVLGPETVDRTIDEWWSLEGLREEATGDDRVFLVAEREGSLVGVVDAGPDPDTGVRWRVPRLYVHPDHWGEGLGTRLVDAIRERLPPGTETLGLVVLAENDVGRSFYETYGFERVESRTDEIGGTGREEYVYELSV